MGWYGAIYKSKTVVIGWILLLFLFSIAHIQLEETERGKREKSCTSFDVVCFISFRIILLLLLFLLDSMRTIVPFRSKRASRATCRRCANGAFFDD
jgi:NADH:ubiquinone oxidoreductase subunit 6 (subunit J)